MMTNIYKLELLGHPRLICRGDLIEDFISTKAQALLFYLAVTRREHSRQKLSALLWGDMPSSSALSNLRQALHNLRQIIGDNLIVSHQAVSLNPDFLLDVDVNIFETSLLRASQASDLKSYEEAATMYRGDFLEGFFVRDSQDFEDWALSQRERLREQILQALHCLAELYTENHDYLNALKFLSRLLDIAPWREESHRQKMLLLARTGQRTSALNQYANCRQILADELGVEPSVDTTSLYYTILEADATPTNNLPFQATPFIGRESELAEISKKLGNPDCRLITIVGLGGVGKTRLALQCLGQADLDIGKQFLNGIYLVPLAPIRTVEGLIPAIADSIGLSVHARERSKIQLLNYLRNKEILLILDNFEHLLDAANFLTELLQTAPQLKLIVTSRVRLNLQSEFILPLNGLSYPREDHFDIEAANYSAIQLFIRSAQKADPGFSYQKAESQVIIHICKLLDGFPLGIELAASWVKVIPIPQIARELEYNLDILASSLRDLPERQWSLRAIFEQTWSLLSEHEKASFMKLSIFQGGCNWDAAQKITSTSLSILSALIDRSLLRREGERYVMNEVSRRFAELKFNEAPDERDKALDLHCGYYLTFLSQQNIRSRGKPALTEITREFENIRRAWEQALKQMYIEEIEVAMENMANYYRITGLSFEGEIFYRSAIQNITLHEHDAETLKRKKQRILGNLHLYRANFLIVLAKFEQAFEATGEGIALCHLTSDVKNEALGYLNRGKTLQYQQKYLLAQEHFEKSLSLAREYVLPQIEGMALHQLGNLQTEMGNFVGGQSNVNQCLEIFREIDDWHNASLALNTLGIISWHFGDLSCAREHLEQSLSISTEQGYQQAQCSTLINLGNIYWDIGDKDKTQSCLNRAREICRQIGDRANEVNVLNNLGLVSDQLGDYETAKECFSLALHMNRAIGSRGLESIILTNFSLLYHHLDKNDSAKEHASRAVRISQELDNHLIECDAQLMYGHALAGLRKLDEASSAYRRAYALRTDLGQHHFAIECKASLVLVALAQGDYAMAQLLSDEILHYMNENGVKSMLEPFRVYWACYLALKAMNDMRASDILVTAHTQLQVQADQISNEQLRRSFLEEVTLNREIIHHFQTWKGQYESQAHIAQPCSLNKELLDPLSPKEIEVLQLVARGHSNKAVADKLVITVGTVKSHINRILSKLDVKNRTEAVARAREMGITN